MTFPSTRATCYRHPDRPTGLACSECGRPICADCSIEAAVGQRCPECVRAQGTQRVVHARALARPAPTPWTYAIIGITVVVHLVSVVSPGAWSEIVARLAMWNVAVAAGEWWRMLTVTLVHANLTHILFNMLALYNLGPQIERELGGVRLLALYGASAAAGSAFAFLLGNRSDIGVGASGAIFGLFGVWLASAVRRRSTAYGRALLSQLGVILVINAAIPFLVRNVSWQAHLGGLLAGFLIGQVWSRSRSFGVHLASAGVVLALSFAVPLL